MSVNAFIAQGMPDLGAGVMDSFYRGREAEQANRMNQMALTREKRTMDAEADQAKLMGVLALDAEAGEDAGYWSAGIDKMVQGGFMPPDIGEQAKQNRAALVRGAQVRLGIQTTPEDPYKVAGGQIFDTRNQSWLTPPSTGQDLPKDVQSWQFYNSLSPEDQKRWLEKQRASQTYQVGPVPYTLTPGDKKGTPLATPEDVATNTAAVTRANAEVNADVPSPQSVAKAKEKINILRALKDQLGRVEKAWAKIRGTASAGKGQGWVPSPDGESFDKAAKSLAPFIRQITRTPGEGAMSDYESKLAEAINLQRGEFEDVTEQQIQALRDLVGTIETGYVDLLGVSSEAPATNAPKKGDVDGGYVFMGGDPSNPSNWRKQ